MDQQSIYGTIKTNSKLGNKEAHLLAGVIWSKVLAYGKFWEKEGAKAERAKVEAEKQDSSVRLTDEERKEKLEIKLDAMLTDPKTSAADIKEFRDYFGLGGKKSDIIIEPIDYKDVYPEDADVIAVTAELIRKSIEEADEKE